jgi:hypothetical protein
MIPPPSPKESAKRTPKILRTSSQIEIGSTTKEKR